MMKCYLEVTLLTVPTNIDANSFIKKEAVDLGKYYKISNSYGNGHIWTLKK